MRSNFDHLNAHSPREKSRIWHKLNTHLLAVARLASKHAAPFGASEIAFLAGLWHDLGKANPEFQDYLEACDRSESSNSVPHAAAGAAFAYRLFRKYVGQDTWPEISLPTVGHHGGLPELGESAIKLHEAANNLIPDVVNLANVLPTGMNSLETATGTRREFRLRMIFSSLVDADYLDTEEHFNPHNSSIRGEWTRPADLWSIFRPNQLRMMWSGRGKSSLNRIRREIYRESVKSSARKPGIFRLTVPTGGGKTRCALAFAIRHSINNWQHHFRRIIIGLPYTSIIDQTAQEYREIFGERFVLEHHSQVDVPESEEQDVNRTRERLSSENWDHPLIVTTTVQLFESLFHNKPSRCRKLHNIAKSILILDEVQTLPPELLLPTLDVLRDLVDNYGVTIVLSTATQPAYDQTPYIEAFDGLKIEELIREPTRHFLNEAVKRVEYQPVRWNQNLDELATELCDQDESQSMVIFNTRKAALDLHERLLQRNVKGVYHLSTLLCGKHRRRILKEIRHRLKIDDPQPVRLVST